MSKRAWSVETTRDTFDNVKAERMRVDFGAVVFYRFDRMDGEIVELAYAPGQWLTVSEAEE